MKVFTSRLYAALEKHLYQISYQPITEGEKLKQKIIGCKKALEILKRYVASYFFSNCEEEIEFFKIHKPKFYSQYIYQLFVYKYVMKKPMGCEESLQNYIKAELHKMKTFFDQNQSFCCYYRSGDSHLDQLYFTRCRCELYAEFDDFQVDDLFSTSHDYRLSKLIALERYQTFLLQQKHEIENGISIENKPSIAWTGNQTELIELIYALAESGALNNGNIEIKTAIEFFQQTFQIDLKHYYHKFRDITNRKKERAVFLDKLKVSLDRKIESRFV